MRVYEGVNPAGFGTGAAVTGLAAIASPNSPSVQSTSWSTLLKRKNRDGGATYYVAGHLVNGTFGGPGSDWRSEPTRVSLGRAVISSPTPESETRPLSPAASTVFGST